MPPPGLPGYQAVEARQPGGGCSDVRYRTERMPPFSYSRRMARSSYARPARGPSAEPTEEMLATRLEGSGLALHQDSSSREVRASSALNLALDAGVVLLGLCLLGVVSSSTLGGFIFVALVIGVILVAVGLGGQFSRRRR